MELPNDETPDPSRGWSMQPGETGPKIDVTNVDVRVAVSTVDARVESSGRVAVPASSTSSPTVSDVRSRVDVVPVEPVVARTFTPIGAAGPQPAAPARPAPPRPAPRPSRPASTSSIDAPTVAMPAPDTARTVETPRAAGPRDAEPPRPPIGGHRSVETPVPEARADERHPVARMPSRRRGLGVLLGVLTLSLLAGGIAMAAYVYDQTHNSPTSLSDPAIAVTQVADLS